MPFHIFILTLWLLSAIPDSQSDALFARDFDSDLFADAYDDPSLPDDGSLFQGMSPT